jgi:hypothetical protein
MLLPQKLLLYTLALFYKTRPYFRFQLAYVGCLIHFSHNAAQLLLKTGFQQISHFHSHFSYTHSLSPCFWGPICLGGGRFSWIEGQGNTQQITHNLNTTDEHTDHLRASPHPLSCSTHMCEFEILVFWNFFWIFGIYYFLTLLVQNPMW